MDGSLTLSTISREQKVLRVSYNKTLVKRMKTKNLDNLDRPLLALRMQRKAEKEEKEF